MWKGFQTVGRFKDDDEKEFFEDAMDINPKVCRYGVPF